MNPAAVGHDDVGQEDFAAEAITTITPPVPPPSARQPPTTPEAPLPPTLQGTCVNCGRHVTLRQVATDSKRHTYQWVPDDEVPRAGKRCSEAAMPAYHWAESAIAAVYRIST